MRSGPVKPLETLPGLGLLALTRAALGCGIGILVANKFQRPAARQTTALALVFLGLAGSLPWLVQLVLGVVNRPDSARGVQRRLASIRANAGYDNGTEMF